MPRLALIGSVSARAFGFAGSVSDFQVGVTPSSISTSGGYDGGTKTTASVTVNVVSGNATGLSFSWAKVSGSTMTCNSPTAPTTTFTGTPPNENSNLVTVWRCTVTNSLAQVATVDITSTISAGLAGLNVSVSPSGGTAHPPSGSPYSFGVSASASAGAGGISPPLSYSWSPSGNISPTNTASSTFTMPSNSPGAHDTFLLVCTVTDSAGRVGQGAGGGNIDWV